MRFSKSYILVALALLASTLSWTQQAPINEHASVLVRMSFASSWVPSGLGGFPQICFSVDRSGNFEMRRVTIKTTTEPREGSPNNNEIVRTSPHVDLLQGTLAPVELEKLEKLLEDSEFSKLSSAPPSILRKGAETFVAEVPRENGMQRVVMSNADRDTPFPRSAERIVNWLQHFKAEGAKPLDVSAEDICPRGTVQPVHPATALLQPMASPAACVTR
jgi:hypothetical protein